MSSQQTPGIAELKNPTGKSFVPTSLDSQPLGRDGFSVQCGKYCILFCLNGISQIM